MNTHKMKAENPERFKLPPSDGSTQRQGIEHHLKATPERDTDPRTLRYNKLPRGTQQQANLLKYHITTLCIRHQLPYSFTDWDSEAERGAVGLLRGVACRVGGLLISQCATERANKLTKEVWTADRRSITPEHMARDVFLYCNQDRHHPPVFNWGGAGPTQSTSEETRRKL